MSTSTPKHTKVTLNDDGKSLTVHFDQDISQFAKAVANDDGHIPSHYVASALQPATLPTTQAAVSSVGAKPW